MKWIKGIFIKFLKWIMKQKSVSTMGFIVLSIFIAGYYTCSKDISMQTVIDLYNDFIKVEVIPEKELVKQDSIFVYDSIKVVK